MVGLLNSIITKLTETSKSASIGDKSVTSNSYAFSDTPSDEESVKEQAKPFYPVNYPPSSFFDLDIRSVLAPEKPNASSIKYADDLYNKTQSRQRPISLRTKYSILT